MTDRRTVEVYSAGCPLCDDAATLVKEVAGPAHEVAVLSLNETAVASRARALGVRGAPAVAIDGELLACCAGRSVSERVLREHLEQPAAGPGEKEASPRRGGCC